MISLGLAIGANTAIFSLVYTVILRKLPVQHPEQLVEFLNEYPGDPPLNFFSRQSYEHYRDHNHVFSEITADHAGRLRVQGKGLEAETLEVHGVAGNFFQMLGIQPARGRLIRPDHDARAAIAVVSWSYWKRYFNLDPAVVGRQIVVNDVPVTIIGVAPREFSGLLLGRHPDVWVPLGLIRSEPLMLIARMKPGVSITEARAEMAVLFRFTFDERNRNSKDAANRQLKFIVEPAGAGLSTALRREFAKPLVALMAVVALLLLVACTNVAGLLLARAAGREREMAVRVSLGAGRIRLLRQALTESVLLAATGAALGIFLAYFGSMALVRIATSGRFIGGSPDIEIRALPDGQVLLFTCGIALAAGVLFGLAPAWSTFVSAPVASLRNSGRAGETRLQRRLGKSLVAAQVALSVGLVSAAALFIGHLSKFENMDLGFRRDHVLLMTLDPGHSRYTAEGLADAYEELLARLEKIPGVRSATINGPGPLSGAGAALFVNVASHPERPEDRRYVFADWVAPKYFETLGTRLVAGRGFRFDDRGKPRVAVINEAMAHYYFADGVPIGKEVTVEGEAKPYEIIGVAENANYSDIHESALRRIYFDTLQFPGYTSTFALRTSVNSLAVASAARRIAGQVLKGVPVERITTLTDQVDATIVPERLVAFVSGMFGGLGALLTAVGIYGLLAYTVARRTNEIGVRMALGATRGDVTKMVLQDAMRMVGAGLALGVPLTFWGQRFAASLMAGLPATSAGPAALAAATIIAAGALAAYLPARRAAHVDPMDALRSE